MKEHFKKIPPILFCCLLSSTAMADVKWSQFPTSGLAVTDTIVGLRGGTNYGFTPGLLATLAAVDLSGSQATGTLACARMPALTGNITTSAGACATTIGAGVVTNAMLAGSIDLTSKVTGLLPSANGGAGTLTGILKATAGTTSAAVSGTDYAAANAPGLIQGASNMVWVPVGAHYRGIMGTGSSVTITPTGTAGVNTQTIWWNNLTEPIMATRVVFANFDMSSTGETDRPSTEIFTSFKASLNFQQVNTTPIPYTFNGASSTTLTAPQTPLPHGFIISDPLYYPIQKNNSFAIRAAGSIASTTTYQTASFTDVAGGTNTTRITNGTDTPGGAAITNFSEFDNRVATGWVDHTTDATALSMTSGSGFSLAPSLVLGLVRAPAHSIGLFGDSIMQGQGQNAPDSLFNVGYAPGGLSNSCSWFNFSRGSLKASFFNTFTKQQGILSLIQGTGMYLTDMVIGLGRNDMATGGATEAIVKAAVSTVALPFQQQGYPVWVQTLPPWTASTDAWATLTNQFYITANQTSSALASSGTSTISLASASSVSNGQLIATAAGTCITPGTTITVSGLNVTLSSPTTCDIASGTTINFGSATPNNYTSTAITYNTNLKANYASAGYNNSGFVYAGTINLDAVAGNVSGSDYKWAINGGAHTLDGVHPGPVTTAAAISAGTVSCSNFGKNYNSTP